MKLSCIVVESLFGVDDAIGGKDMLISLNELFVMSDSGALSNTLVLYSVHISFDCEVFTLESTIVKVKLWLMPALIKFISLSSPTV